MLVVWWWWLCNGDGYTAMTLNVQQCKVQCKIVFSQNNSLSLCCVVQWKLLCLVSVSVNLLHPSSSLIFFVSSSLIFFIVKIFSIWLLYQGSLAPVHRWGFSTSAVTGPQQGGRLALPPGVATQKTLKKLLNRVKQRQSFNLRQQVRFCISYGSFDEKPSNSVCPYLLKTNLCQAYNEGNANNHCIACPLWAELGVFLR